MTYDVIDRGHMTGRDDVMQISTARTCHDHVVLPGLPGQDHSIDKDVYVDVYL